MIQNNRLDILHAHINLIGYYEYKKLNSNHN